MFKKYHQALMFVYYCLDLVLTLAALTGAELLYRRVAGDPGWPWPGLSSYALVAAIWAIAFRILPLYQAKRAVPLPAELAQVAQAVVLCWLALVAWTRIFDHLSFTRLFLIYFGLLDLCVLLAFHLVLRIALRTLRSMNYNLKQVLIIGAGTVGQQVVRALGERPWAGYKVVGFLDPDAALTGQTLAGVPVLGDLKAAHGVVEALDADDEVIITLHPGAYEQLVEVVEAIEDLPVNVRVVPDLFGVVSIRPTVEDLWGIPLIGIRQPPVTGMAEAVKRAIDVLGALAGLLLCSPLFALVAILVKLDSPGPVLYTQQRVGQNGRSFRMYKFRTMVAGADRMLDQLVDLDCLEEPVFKLKDDPRVTRVGRILRRTSLDELPQLVNVLKGEMSLVGPRPEETRLVQRYTSWHRKRLMMKPGMTGPAQVGGRGDLPLKTRVQLELDYIADYSLWKDLRILAQTLAAVIRGTGAH